MEQPYKIGIRETLEITNVKYIFSNCKTDV
jgi:hypothetical protein